MSLESDFFTKKRFVPDRLLAYGFVQDGESYHYRAFLMAGEFEARLTVNPEGQLSGALIDRSTGELYQPLYAVRQQGAYVGQVRSAYLALLENLSQACCQAQPFTQAQANRLAQHLQAHFGDQPDYPFAKHPDYASYRVQNKWYALVFPLSRQKLDSSAPDERVEVVNVKVQSDQIQSYLSQASCYPSYHMAKKNWVTVVLDEGLSDAQLWDIVARSRALVTGRQADGTEGYFLTPANPKVFDVDAAFAQDDQVLWWQQKTYQVGDKVGLYMTAPIKALRYLCEIVEMDLVDQGRPCVRLKHCQTFTDQAFPLERLKSLGVTNIRGHRRMTPQLIEALKVIDKSSR